MLTINKVRKSDAGRYRCEAVNSIGHVYREMNLIVNCKYTHVLSCQPRVTVMSCFVHKIIRDL